MISFEDLRLASGGQLFGEIAATSYSDFCSDWRNVQPGQLYVALKTGIDDGHRHIADAIAAGASGVLCTKPPSGVDVAGTTVLVVEGAEAALTAWAKHILSKFGTTMVAVTGAVGEASAAQGLSAILQTRYSVFNVQPKSSGAVAVSLALGTLTPEHDIILFQLGCGSKDEIPGLLTVARPHMAVVTSAGVSRGESLAENNGVLRELQQVVDAVPSDGGLVLNYDDDVVRQLGFSSDKQVVNYGLDISGRGFGADLLAYNVEFFVDKIGFDLRHGGEQLPGHWIPWLGRYQLYGALAAAAAGMLFDVPLPDALRSLSGLEQIPGQMCRFEGVNDSVLIDNSFNADLASTSAALDFFEMLGDTQRRRIFVMGSVDASDEVSEEAYRAVGKQAREVCDLLVVHGKHAAISGRAAREAGLSGEQVQMAYGRADVVRVVRDFVQPGDMIVITGAANTRMERISRQLLANPERDAEHLPQRQPGAMPVMGDLAGIASWVELDLDASAHNFRKLKEHIGPDVTLMAVVKANAYGHGAVEIASTAIHNGAGYLGVDNLGEALELRRAGIDAPILVLGFTPAWAVRQAVLNEIAMTITDAQSASDIDYASAGLGRPARVHIKVDSGMGRLGLLPEDVPEFFRQLRSYNNLDVEGILTHLSVADSHSHASFTADQIAIFEGVLDGLTASGFSFRYVHAANSAATLAHPEAHFSMVRVGVAMHGVSPSADVICPPDFRSVLSWKSRVVQVKVLPPGSTVGYGNTYYTSGTEKIALIPVGYADGFRLAPNNWGEVLIGGRRAAIVGRISMGMTAINVTHIPDVSLGDEVVLIGRQGDETISAEDVARQLNTISYEVICAIADHLPRVVQ